MWVKLMEKNSIVHGNKLGYNQPIRRFFWVETNTNVIITDS